MVDFVSYWVESKSFFPEDRFSVRMAACLSGCLRDPFWLVCDVFISHEMVYLTTVLLRWSSIWWAFILVLLKSFCGFLFPMGYIQSPWGSGPSSRISFSSHDVRTGNRGGFEHSKLAVLQGAHQPTSHFLGFVLQVPSALDLLCLPSPRKNPTLPQHVTWTSHPFGNFILIQIIFLYKN